ncbi:hypothetical protein D3C84_1030570 [compost metagenome]
MIGTDGVLINRLQQELNLLSQIGVRHVGVLFSQQIDRSCGCWLFRAFLCNDRSFLLRLCLFLLLIDYRSLRSVLINSVVVLFHGD